MTAGGLLVAMFAELTIVVDLIVSNNSLSVVELCSILGVDSSRLSLVAIVLGSIQLYNLYPGAKTTALYLLDVLVMLYM